MCNRRYLRYFLEALMILCLFTVYLYYRSNYPIQPGRPSVQYTLNNRESAEIEYVFAKLEYIGYLITGYMKSGKEIAEGNYDVSKLLKTLRSEEREPEDLNGHKMMREFLFIAQKSSDLLEMLSQRLLNENNPYYLLGKEKYDIDYGNRLIRNCFIKRSPVSLDYVCVGIELPEVYDAVYKGQRVKVYPKILASIRNGYYFRDIFTSPYDGGSVIIIMLKLAETLSKES